MVLFGALLAVAIDIDNGRQLFVDDFLVATTNGIVRHWNRPLKVERPVLRPAFATDSGLWWDPRIGKYRLWYEKEWAGDLRYAESADGLDWTLPDLGIVKGTNRLFWRTASRPISTAGALCRIMRPPIRTRTGG